MIQTNPNTFSIPYTIPMMVARLASPHIATSDADHPVVFAPLIVGIKTVVVTRIETVRLMMPIKKFAIVLSPPYTSFGGGLFIYIFSI